MSSPKPSTPPPNRRRLLSTNRLTKRQADLRAAASAPAVAATQNPSTSAADPATATPAPTSQGDANPAHGDGWRAKRVREAAREATAAADVAAPIESATNPRRPVANPYKKRGRAEDAGPPTPGLRRPFLQHRGASRKWRGAVGNRCRRAASSGEWGIGQDGASARREGRQSPRRCTYHWGRWRRTGA